MSILYGISYIYDNCAVPRTKIQKGIYTSINTHPTINIPLHNEKSYATDFPSHIYFNSLQSAETGGFTPLIDAHQLFLALPELLQKKLLDKGVKYRHYYYGSGLQYRLVNFLGKGINCTTWMKKFNTYNKDEVERILKAADTPYQWLNTGDALVTEIKLPAIRVHPVTQKLVWFNQMHYKNYFINPGLVTINRTIDNPIAHFILSLKSYLPSVAFFGDGEPLSRHEVYLIDRAVKSLTNTFAWQDGDVMIVDNYSCMHGKTPHSGERLLLVAMTS